MIKENISDIIKERIRISDETQDNWDYGIEQCWKKYIDILSADIEKSIDFFLHDCTDEEFYWLSEAFEEIADKTQSKNLISTWRSRLAAVTSENYCQENFISKEMRQQVDYPEYVRSIEQEINYAERKIGK